MLGFTPGDANLDGNVDGADAALMADHWGETDWMFENITWMEGDFNIDGSVNQIDASIMAANWTSSTPFSEAFTIPEPSMLVMLIGVFCSLAMFRRR